jgi:N-carbamoyl-L-amino-acid hydrolase
MGVMMARFEVNSERLERTIEELASIGKGETGITRLPLSPEDREARRYVMAVMEEAGLEVRADPVGNIYGKRMQAADASLPSIMSGSHICTGTNYGKYDGTVGVLGALEAIRLFNEQDITTVHPLEVAVFTAEEPQRFKGFQPGSQSVAGRLTGEDLRHFKDEDGISFWDALVSAGYHPENLTAARRTRETIKAYVEMHIEQGRVLEDAGKRIGIVTAIAAPTRFMVTITGRADHSGATPMGLRKDALCAAAELILAMEQYGRAEAEHSSVATVGYAKVEPGSMVVIPGQATISVDIRGIDSASKRRVFNNAQRKMADITQERDVNIDMEMIHDAEPVPLSDTVIGSIKETCGELGIDALVMHSGAGHDAQQIASFTDAGMIFVPSVEGVSHNPAEYTRIEDIALGTELLAHVLLKLSGEEQQGA